MFENWPTISYPGMWAEQAGTFLNLLGGAEEGLLLTMNIGHVLMNTIHAMDINQSMVLCHSALLVSTLRNE